MTVLKIQSTFRSCIPALTRGALRSRTQALPQRCTGSNGHSCGQTQSSLLSAQESLCPPDTLQSAGHLPKALASFMLSWLKLLTPLLTLVPNSMCAHSPDKSNCGMHRLVNQSQPLQCLPQHPSSNTAHFKPPLNPSPAKLVPIQAPNQHYFPKLPAYSHYSK